VLFSKIPFNLSKFYTTGGFVLLVLGSTFKYKDSKLVIFPITLETGIKSTLV